MNYYTEDREDENILCPDCGGTGLHPYLSCKCGKCGGSGMIQDSYEIDHPLVSYRRLKRYPPRGANDLEYA